MITVYTDWSDLKVGTKKKKCQLQNLKVEPDAQIFINLLIFFCFDQLPVSLLLHRLPQENNQGSFAMNNGIIAFTFPPSDIKVAAYYSSVD